MNKKLGMFGCTRCGERTNSQFLINEGFLCTQCAEKFVRDKSIEIDKKISRLKFDQNYWWEEFYKCCPREELDL